MPEVARNTFVLKKDIYVKCLVIYPMDEWDRHLEELFNKTNKFNQEHKSFIREYSKDTAELELDANNRLLIPSRFLKLAGIEKDVVLAGQFSQIEIWAKDLYDQTSMSSEEYSALAEKIMGGNKNNTSAL
ncbi:MAG: division/cell wall cluster transcriptional repressor MraZ [Bacteroidetes bacterium]|nr:division/cell wall cluster transcriptional repressor MraZ [Bacteroidota bacterium]